MIEASAGTGKTHQLTQYFLSLIDRNDIVSSLKRLMAVTFSDKAAIEMKQRILSSLDGLIEQLDEYSRLEAENALLRLNVCTIHSFCRRLLQRFAFHAKIDPFFRIIDRRESEIYLDEAISTYLRNLPANSPVFSLAQEFTLGAMIRLWRQFHERYPHVLIGQPAQSSLSSRIFFSYQAIRMVHTLLKKERSGLDFDDLEWLAYQLLRENPSSLIILEDFDERISFLLVDEFQDINLLQWEIIRALTEEWFSGRGAKAESEETYGLFLVGDRKQSIYAFRGAESDIFDRALDYLGSNIERETLSVSQRSCPKVIEFVNRLFRGNFPWSKQSLAVNPLRGFPEKQAAVEIFLLPENRSREEEYRWVAWRIWELVNSKAMVYQRDGTSRPICFRDIAILLRRRGLSLPVLERTLSAYSIPYLVVGGIGFYQEPEIRFLLSLVFALADGTDLMALWNLEKSDLRISKEQVRVWQRASRQKKPAELVEEILEQIGFWKSLSAQQQANVEKFLAVIEEQPGLSMYEIAQVMRKASYNTSEPKANICSEGEEAVRILTIHAAKGLEFSAVFVISIDESRLIDHSRVIFEKNVGKTPAYTLLLKKEATAEQKENFARLLKEEEQRIFYVAVTRASQYLFLSGFMKNNVWWAQPISALLSEYQPLLAENFPPPLVKPIPRLSEEEKHSFLFPSFPEKVTTAGLGDFLLTQAGDIIHRLLREMSLGKLPARPGLVTRRLVFYYRKSHLFRRRPALLFLKRLMNRILANETLMEIIRPQPLAYAELPFLVEVDGQFVRGVMDRVIFKNREVWIYDYKLTRENLEAGMEQLRRYLSAAEKIFPGFEVKGRLVILKEGKVIRCLGKDEDTPSATIDSRMDKGL
ncbi:MAG: UvrD-helicase domain-containing protein [Candidatus Omnitrophica bacterium]|nr:UvrD-helicase domain-containing protein [Candidatus Omnitrophota bacterium]